MRNKQRYLVEDMRIIQDLESNCITIFVAKYFLMGPPPPAGCFLT